jgi:hypothetical protein
MCPLLYLGQGRVVRRAFYHWVMTITFANLQTEQIASKFEYPILLYLGPPSGAGNVLASRTVIT